MKVTGSSSSKIKSRRNFIFGADFFSLFSFRWLSIFSKKDATISCAPEPEKKKTIKVLGQDGRLVEIDVSKIKQVTGKISDEELKHWVKR
jgi:hypothetical protein